MTRKSARVAARKPELSAAPKTKNHTEGLVPSSQLIGFLDLPIEVRVMIYKLRFTGATLFINDDGIDLECSRARGEIARASKEIYSESMPILYSLTILVYQALGLSSSFAPLPMPSIIPDCRPVTSTAYQQALISILRPLLISQSAYLNPIRHFLP